MTQNVTIAETTSEEMTTEQTDVEETQNVPMMEETALEPAPEEWEAWQKKALDVMQSAEVPFYPELISFTFTLKDLSRDGIPEIIETTRDEEPFHMGPEAIWTWHNGNYTRAYSADSDRHLNSIEPYRNKQTGENELWDLGNIDYQLEDYYPDDPHGWSSAVFPPIGSINENINQFEFKDGKLIIAESHDELKNFATPDMTDEQVRRAWEALHDFSKAFWQTHEREPVEIHSTSIEYFQFDRFYDTGTYDPSALYALDNLPPYEFDLWSADYNANLEPQYETESYRYNRNHLRAIIEDY